MNFKLLEATLKS